MANNEIKIFPRVATGIKGLDRLLGGGFLKGGIYLLMGPPGSGKTIIANQFGFNFVAGGNRALYVSLLSESHSRLFGHLKPMRFFREESISDSFNFVSAYHVLEKDGLDGLLRSIAQTVRHYKATLLFIDGVASAEELANSTVSFKKFVHELNTVLNASGCTAVLLSSLNHLTHPEHTMVDGIISLTMNDEYPAPAREIQIPKMRGSRQLTGKHIFTITDDGITVYPKIESYLGRQGAAAAESAERLSIGQPSIDEMLGGGIVAGSVTSLIGPAGCGKTLLGTSFLTEGAIKGEDSLYFGLYENPQRLLRKMEKINRGIRRGVDGGKLHFLWQPAYEAFIDEMVDRMLQMVERQNIKRLFIDGIVGFRESVRDPDRFYPAITALANELRHRGVTTIFTEETRLFPLEAETPVSDHSAITDNILYMRHVDTGVDLLRLISVLKTRESPASSQVFEFEITSRGFGLKKSGQRVGAAPSRVFQGEAQPKKKSSAPRARGARAAPAGAKRKPVKRK